MATLRKLRAEEVTFELSIEPEEDGPEGHFASGDDAVDAENCAAIRERLDRDEQWAWCIVTVTARWDNFSASDNRGGCSYDDEENFKREGYYEDMCANALDALNAELAARFEDLSPLLG